MACSQQPGAAPFVDFIADTTGHKLSARDWHAVKQLAADEGYDLSRRRVDLDDVADAMAELTTTVDAEAGNPKGASVRAGVATIVTLNDKNVTQNTLSIVSYLAKHGVGNTLARIESDRKGVVADAAEPDPEADLANQEMEFDRQADVLANEMGVNFGAAADFLWKNPDLYAEAVKGLSHERKVEIVRESGYRSTDKGAEEFLRLQAAAREAEFESEVAEEARAQQDDLDDGFDDSLTDVEADADTLAGAGFGTDEDYGYFGGEDDYS